MSFKHLTLNERNKIEVLIKEGYSSRGIAKILAATIQQYQESLNAVKLNIKHTQQKKIKSINLHLKAEKINQQSKL